MPPCKSLARCCIATQFNHSVMSNSLQPHELQHARSPCPSPTPRVSSNSCPSSWWCQHHPSQHQGHFQWVNSSHEVAKVLEFQLQYQSFQWTPRTDLLTSAIPNPHLRCILGQQMHCQYATGRSMAQSFSLKAAPGLSLQFCQEEYNF